MSSRQTDDYIAVFEAVQNLPEEDLSLERMTTDFEVATWKWFRAVFPGVPVKGCTFHFNQAVYRKIQDLGLAPAYNTDVATHKFCKKLMALPFLHADHVRPAFDKLRGKQETEGLGKLCSYIETTWMKNTTYRLQDGCVFGQAIRTNNDLEAWHHRLNQKAGRKNLPLYTLIPFLNAEADLLPMQSRLLTDGQLDRRQTPAQKKKAKKYFALWDNYTEGDLSPSQLLREVAKMNGPVCQ
ncbi:uncharacterized protein LOC121388117 isoform X2 [Gigantopelta aegis]|nr:uncharacterized protein LOC121388117 isoform X2 [Gigantopelta aegis]